MGQGAFQPHRSPCRFSPCVGRWLGQVEGLDCVEASIHKWRHRFAAQASCQAPTVPPLFVHLERQGVERFGQRPGPHRAVHVQQVVVLHAFQRLEDFPCASLDGVHLVEPRQQGGGRHAALQANQIHRGVLPEFPPEHGDQGLHEQHITEGAEPRNQKPGRRRINHVSKVARLLSSHHHAPRRHPHPPVSAGL